MWFRVILWIIVSHVELWGIQDFRSSGLEGLEVQRE